MTGHIVRILALTLVIQVLSTGASVQAADESAFDRVWNTATLYENNDNPYVEKFAISGRLQADGAWFDSEEEDYDDAKWRRLRLGFKTRFLQNFFAHAEMDLNLNKAGSNDSYKGLTDSYIGWSKDKAFSTKVGKQSAGFTLDGATSSTKLLTMERSLVAENIWFPTEYFTGASGYGTVDRWKYKLGGFSSSGDPEFSQFDSGWFALASLGREVSENVKLRLDYVYNDPDYSGDVGTSDLKNVVSLVSQIEMEKAGLWTDISFAEGIEEQSDLLGLQVMPFWSFNDTWQTVFRYAMVHSGGGAGAQLGRYPDIISGGAMYEDVHDFYLGLNCFLYGHKLKWQSGLEYNYGKNEAESGDSYNGWGFSTGLRISW